MIPNSKSQIPNPKIIYYVIIFLLLPIFLFCIQPVRTTAEELAATFKLEDLKGNTVTLADFKNKPVILFFWTTWCPFCRKEIKALKDIYPQLLKEGLELLVINIGEPAYKVDNLIKNYSLPFNVLLDKDTTVARTYDILGIPAYILIDKTGDIVFRGNYFPRDRYKNLILK